MYTVFWHNALFLNTFFEIEGEKLLWKVQNPNGILQMIVSNQKWICCYILAFKFWHVFE
jgi:hypothetical protein